MDSARAKTMIETMQKRDFQRSPESKRKLSKERKDELKRLDEQDRDR